MRFKLIDSKNLQNSTIRAGIISEAGMNIPTPLRVLNSAEMNNARKIGAKGLAIPELPHPVYEITKFFNPQRIYGLTRDKEVSSAITKDVKRTSGIAGNRITFFHPVLKRDMKITNEINKKMIAMQMMSDIDGISILDDYNSSASEFKLRLRESMAQIDSEDCVKPMATIRMDTDERKFKEKIELILNEGITIFNPTFANIKENWENYSYLIELTRKEKLDNVLIHMSEIPRKLFRINPTSMMHLLSMLSVDSYALNSRPFPIGNIKIKEVVVKRFDPHTIGFITTEEHTKIHGEFPKCDCFVEKGRGNLKEILKIYQAVELLSPAITSHEAISSYYEFLRARKAIEKNEFGDYLRSKKYLSQAAKKILKIDLAQRQL